MSDAPALKRLLILRDTRLPFIDLDLTDAATGDPLGEVCLIGANACGKSTLLARLHEAVTGRPRWMEWDEGYYLAKWRVDGEDLYFANTFGGGDGICFRPGIEHSEDWQRLATSVPTFEDLRSLFASEIILEATPGFGTLPAIWCDPDHCLVDGESPGDLTAFLELSLHERQEAFHRYLRLPENRDKTIAEVETAFDSASTQALPHLREAWNRLLATSGLCVELTGDEARFVDRSGSVLPMERLGASLRRLLLQTGIAASNPEALLFLDEAGAGLHPALALELLPLLRSLGGQKGARRFIATDCPLVASGIAPSSRLRLVPDETGTMHILRSEAAAGADLATLLEKDFGVALLAPAPEESIPVPPSGPSPARLKRAIRESDDEEELADLIDEVMSNRRS